MKEFITNSYAYFWVRFLRCMLTNVAKKITPDKFLYLGYRTPNMTYSRTPNVLYPILTKTILIYAPLFERNPRSLQKSLKMRYWLKNRP